MLNSKLIRLMRGLSETELDDVKRFLDSPFFNTNPSIVRLFEGLLPAYPDFDKEQVNKEELYQMIYPGKAYQDGSFRNLIMDLSRLIREYFRQTEFKNRPLLKDRLLMDAYAQRMLQRDLGNHFEKVESYLEKNPPNDNLQFLEQYLLLRNFYHAPETVRENIKADFFLKMLKSLNYFFVVAKMQLSIITPPANLLKQAAPNFHFKEYIPDYLAQLKDDDALLSLYSMLERVNHDYNYSEEHIDEISSTFKSNYQKLRPFDQKFIFMMIINQMNNLNLRGDKKYLQKMYELYTFGLRTKVTLFKNRLLGNEFINIVTIATRTKEINWAQNFIVQYEKYLPLSDKDISVAVARANIENDLGNYDKVAELLENYSFRKSKLGLHFRFINVKANLEIALRDASHFLYTQTFIKRMEQYIRRNASERREEQTTGFMNFLKAVKLLLNLVKGKDSVSLNKIKTFVEAQSPIIARAWLLQKVADLE